MKAQIIGSLGESAEVDLKFFKWNKFPGGVSSGGTGVPVHILRPANS